MPHLLLHDRKRQLVEMDVVHDVAVAERVNGQLVQGSAFDVAGVFAIETRGENVTSEDLAQAILGVAAPGIACRRKQEVCWTVDVLAPLCHAALRTQQALEFVHQADRHMADSALLGLRVLRGKIDCTAREVHVSQLDAHKFAHTAAQLVDQSHHQFVTIVFVAIEELLKFLDC